MKRIAILTGVPFDHGDKKDLLTWFERAVESKGCKKVYTPNPEILLTSYKKAPYKKILKDADLSLPDGNGLLWATSFLKDAEGKAGMVSILWSFITTYLQLLVNRKGLRKIIPTPIHGSDTFMTINEHFEKTKERVFFFGGSDEVVKALPGALRKAFPKLTIAGNCGGYPFRSKKENEEILRQIRKAKPSILFVALSFPKQEQWIHENQEALARMGVKVAMGVGGTFDFLVGTATRAPESMQKLGLEWLWRLIKEPRRIGRILRAVFVFPYTILRMRIAGKKKLLILPPLHGLVDKGHRKS